MASYVFVEHQVRPACMATIRKELSPDVNYASSDVWRPKQNAGTRQVYVGTINSASYCVQSRLTASLQETHSMAS